MEKIKSTSKSREQAIFLLLYNISQIFTPVNLINIISVRNHWQILQLVSLVGILICLGFCVKLGLQIRKQPDVLKKRFCSWLFLALAISLALLLIAIQISDFL
jgi:hypothetical protein